MVNLCLYILIYAIITTKANANILGTGVRGARAAAEEHIRSREQPHRSQSEVHRSAANARSGLTSWLLLQIPATQGYKHSWLPVTHLARREVACSTISPPSSLNFSHFKVEWFLKLNHEISATVSTTSFILTYYTSRDDNFANATSTVDLWQSDHADFSKWALKGQVNSTLRSEDLLGAAEQSVRALVFDSSPPWPISFELHCSGTFYVNSPGVEPTIAAKVISNRTEYLIVAPDSDRNNSKPLDLCVRPGTRLLSCTIPQDVLKKGKSSNAYRIIPADRDLKTPSPQVLAWLLTQDQEAPGLGTAPEPDSILAWVSLNQEQPLPLPLPHAHVEHFISRDAYVISLEEPLRGHVSCAILTRSSPKNTNANATSYSPSSSLITVALSRTLTFDRNHQIDSIYHCQPKADQPEAQIIMRTPLYLPNSAPLFASTNGLKAAEKSISARVFLRASPLGKFPLVNMLLFDQQSSETSSGPTLLLDSLLPSAQDTETGSFNLWFRLNNPTTTTLPQSSAEPSFSQLDARSMVELYYDTLLGPNNGFKGKGGSGEASNNHSGDGEKEIAEQGFTLIPDHFYHSSLPPCTLPLNAFLLFATDQELSSDRTHPAIKESYYDTVPIITGGEGGGAISPPSERQFVCLQFSTNSSQNQIAFAGALRHAVQFQSRARFSNLPDSRAVKRGSTVRFKCSGLGLPPPRITWLKDGLPLTSSGKVSIVTPWSIKAGHPRAAPTPPLRSRRPSLTLPPPKTVSKKRKLSLPVMNSKVGVSKGGSHIADLVVSNVQEGDTGAYQCLLTQVALRVFDGARNYTLVSPPAHLSLVVLEHEPAAPVAVRGVAIEPTSAYISWDDPVNTDSGNPNLLAYSVHYTAISKINGTPGEEPSKTSESQVIVDPGKRRIVLKRLEPGTLYEIYLVAYNAFSASPNSIPIKLVMPPPLPSSDVSESELISGGKNSTVKSVAIPNETGTRPVNDMPYMGIEDAKSPLQKMPIVLGGKGPNASTWMSYKGEMSWFEKIGDPSLTFEYSNGTRTLTVFYNRVEPGNGSQFSNAWSSYVSGDWTLVYFPIFAQNNPTTASKSPGYADRPLFLSSLELRSPRVSSKTPNRTKDYVTLTGLLPGTLYAFRLIKNASELREIRAHINSYLSSTALRAPTPLNNDTSTITSSSSPPNTYNEWYKDNNHVSGPPNLTNNFNNFAESIRRGWSFYLLPQARDTLELEKGMHVEKMIDNANRPRVRLYTKVIESWLLATILIAATVIVLVALATIFICRRKARDRPAISLNKHYYTGIAMNGLNGHRNNNSTHIKDCSGTNETQTEELLATECLPLRSPPEIGPDLSTHASPLTAYV